MLAPIAERYHEAVRVLAAMHASDLPPAIGWAEGRYDIPPYDLEALCFEASLLVQWYAPHVLGVHVASGAAVTFENIWRKALEPVAAAPATWVLRDCHSPNLIWLPRREGLQRVGLIDFQDCVLGHPAYDLVSLLQDARVDVPAALEWDLLTAYISQRQSDDPAFDVAGFASAYAILGAQRAAKILGIFVRLDKRDGKPDYRRHIPRVLAAFQRNLSHTALADVRAWCAGFVPAILGDTPGADDVQGATTESGEQNS
jgi:aminoglycoside/choline kinase family phosphotransferase